MTLSELSTTLDTLLDHPRFARADMGMNGLQVGRGSTTVTKVAFAVDACIETFKLASDWGAQALVVHHGIYWGRLEPLTEWRYERINYLTTNNLALYASHLPLDAHPTLGNNIGLAKELGLVDTKAWGDYKGLTVGIQGRLPSPLRIEEISERLFGDDRGTLGRLPFGKEHNETVAIISGGAIFEALDAASQGIDCYITGESGHTIYHPCLEAGINVIFGGHYRTEIWGVSNLARWVRDNLGLETRYFDHPTGF